MGSLIDELQRREAAAGAEAEELRGRIAELAERLAQAEERLSRLVITRETVEEVLDGAATEMAPVSPAAEQLEGTALPGPGRSPGRDRRHSENAVGCNRPGRNGSNMIDVSL